MPLWELTRQFRLSETIARGLHFELPGDKAPPFIGLPRFLLALTEPKQETAGSSRDLACELFGSFKTRDALKVLTAHDQKQNQPAEPIASAALVALFEGAKAIRIRAGNDEHIGLRHVLLEVTTTSDPDILSERNQIQALAELDFPKFAVRVAQYCVSNLAIDESLHSWIDTFRERRSPGMPLNWWRTSVVEPERESLRPAAIATCEPDDPWRHAQQDRAGAEREARAFAEMICARRFTPPLAVGVFGNWGSGKSFFMRLLHDQIETLSSSHANVGGKDHGFHGNVAQIRFNAWHYAETNLWASIVDHIFTCLDRLAERKESPQIADQLFDQLDTARRLMIEAAQNLMRNRAERAAAAETLELAKSELAAAHDKARSSFATIASAAWSALATGDTKREIDDAFKDLGLGDAVASAGELHAALTDLCNAGRERQIVNAARWRWLGRGTTVAILAATTLAAPLVLEWIAAKAGLALAPFTAVIASVAAIASGAMTLANRTVRSATDALLRSGKKLDALVAAKTADQQAMTTLAEAAVVRAVANEAEASRRLHAVSERTDAAARAFSAHNSRGQVLRFVRERIAQGDYARQLGFTATVRKDFEELSRLMAADNASDASQFADAENARDVYTAKIATLVDAAKKDNLLDEEEIKSLEETTKPPPQSVERIVERIVLYIDDLDRCPPEQVVAVLQAIHLLLAFPLFVVFVAVDVRWLRDALVQQYAWRMKDTEGGGKTSPADYLEKIFQIPYWVRPVGTDGVRSILKDRFGPANVDVFEERLAGSSEVRGTSTGSAPPIRAADQRRTAVTTRQAENSAPPRNSPRRVSSLRLTHAELTVIDELAGMLGGSPRRVLRFVNVYKIIKASLDDEQVEPFDATGHVAAAACLALNIARPERYAKFVDAVVALPNDCGSPFESLAARFPELRDDRFRPLETLLKAAAKNIADLRRYAELVERYSFQPRALTHAGLSPERRRVWRRLNASEDQYNR